MTKIQFSLKSPSNYNSLGIIVLEYDYKNKLTVNLLDKINKHINDINEKDLYIAEEIDVYGTLYNLNKKLCNDGYIYETNYFECKDEEIRVIMVTRYNDTNLFFTKSGHLEEWFSLNPYEKCNTYYDYIENQSYIFWHNDEDGEDNLDNSVMDGILELKIDNDDLVKPCRD